MHIVTRYGNPTKYSIEPVGTQWHMMDDNGVLNAIFIQASNDESDMQWVRLGDVLERVFHTSLQDPSFMHYVVSRYRYS